MIEDSFETGAFNISSCANKSNGRGTFCAKLTKPVNMMLIQLCKVLILILFWFEREYVQKNGKVIRKHTISTIKK